MKSICFLLALFFAVNASSQTYIGPDVGVSKFNVTAGLKVGYRNSCGYLYEGMIKTHFDRQHAAYFSGSVGYQFNIGNNVRLIPLAGYCYSYNSAEKLWQNKHLLQMSLRVKYKKAYIEIGMNRQTPTISIGLIGYHEDKYYPY